MSEAVIVATARSPIGRAFKGAFKDTRPDQLTATIVQAALDQIPELDPRTIDDLLLGCGMPGGEQGWNMARVVAVLLGLDGVPGATITRYCSSSLQTTRMAMHAIRAGEGQTFISAGVECVSRFKVGSSDTPPVGDADPRAAGTNPYLDVQFDTAHARSLARAAGGAPVWHDPREDGELPDYYVSMGQTAENVAGLRGISRAEQDEYALRSQTLAGKALADGFWAKDITPVTLRRRHRLRRRRVASPADHAGRAVRPETGVPGGRFGHRRQCLPVERRRGRPRDHERRACGRTRDHSAGADRVHRRVRALTRDHGPRTGRGDPARTGIGRDEHQRHRPCRDQRSLCRAGHSELPRARHRHRPVQRARRQHRSRPPVRHDRAHGSPRPCSTASAAATRRSDWKPCASVAVRAWR